MLKKFSLTIACSIAFLLIGDYNITVVDFAASVECVVRCHHSTAR